jgi:hypothetical protein
VTSKKSIAGNHPLARVPWMMGQRLFPGSQCHLVFYDSEFTVRRRRWPERKQRP